MEVLLAEKGALWLRLVARGRSGHRSGDAGSLGGGDNAIERMLGALVALRSMRFGAPDHPLLGAPTLAVGVIAGGEVVNLTPDRCEAEIDVRTLPGMDPDDVERAIRSRVGDGLEIERIDCKPPVETDAGHPFARVCLDAAATARGRPAKPGGAGYYSDAAVLSPAFDLPMVIVGPGELGMSGRTDEYVEIAAVEEAALLYERIARDWLGSGRTGAP